MASRIRLLMTASALLVLGLAPTLAVADPPKCQSTYVKQLLRLKKTLVLFDNRCLDRKNIGTVMVDCPDPLTAAKILDIEEKVRDKIASECTLADATALGFPGSCNLGAASS